MWVEENYLKGMTMTDQRTRYLFEDKSFGNYGTPTSEAEALYLISLPHVADSYTDPAGTRLNRPDTEVHEVYSEDETPEDYPDGDPYAATLTVLPRGWHWDSGTPAHDDETPEGCRLILLRAKAEWECGSNEEYTIEAAICERLNCRNAEIDIGGDVWIFRYHEDEDEGADIISSETLISLVGWMRERKMIN